MNFKVLSAFLAVSAMIPFAMSQTAGQPTCAKLNRPDCASAPQCACPAGSTCCPGDAFGRAADCCAQNTDLLTPTTAAPPGTCGYLKDLQCNLVNSGPDRLCGTTGPLGSGVEIPCDPGYTCCPGKFGPSSISCCVNNVDLGITTVPTQVTTTVQTKPTTAVTNPTKTGSISCSKLNQIDCTLDFGPHAKCDSTNPCDTGYTCCDSGRSSGFGVRIHCCVSNTDYLTPSTVFPPAECANLISRDCTLEPGSPTGQCTRNSCGAGFTCCPASTADPNVARFIANYRCCVNNTNRYLNPTTTTAAPPGSCGYLKNNKCFDSGKKSCSPIMNISPCDPGYTCCASSLGMYDGYCCVNNVDLGITTG